LGFLTGFLTLSSFAKSVVRVEDDQWSRASKGKRTNETARERSKARTSPSCDAAAALLDGEWQEEAERSSRIAATTSMPIEKRQRAEVKQEEHAERPELQLGLPYNWSGILV